VACRIHDAVVRGVIDNRVPGLVTGQLWLAGRAAPIQVRLRGNGWRDVAGCEITFEHNAPETLRPNALAVIQEGVVGDLTASRRAKIPLVPMSEVKEYYARREPLPCRWANLLYLEWFSERNGRVLLESHEYTVHITERVWALTESEELEQRKVNAAALKDFMRRMIQG
jgi:hypothetical protein